MHALSNFQVLLADIRQATLQHLVKQILADNWSRPDVGILIEIHTRLLFPILCVDCMCDGADFPVVMVHGDTYQTECLLYDCT